LRRVDASQASSEVVAGGGVVTTLVIIAGGILLAVGCTTYARDCDVADRNVVEDLRGMGTVVEIVKLGSSLSEPSSGALLD
jgi:hypothetical protein